MFLKRLKVKKIKNFENLGKLFDKSWQTKKLLSKKISNKNIDDAYTVAINSGSLGGKIAGAGGGGFLLLITPINKKKQVVINLNNFIEVPIKYEPYGSRVIMSS